VKIADYHIDEITSQMNREFGQRASAGLDLARTPEERQRIIDQLVKDVAGNTSADPRSNGRLPTLLQASNREIRNSSRLNLVILAASQKLDEYIRLKKADEAAILDLTRSVGVNSEKNHFHRGRIANLSRISP